MKSEINAEASKTKNYQKYTVSVKQVVEHDTQAELEFIIDELQMLCRRKVMQQIAMDDELMVKRG